MKNESDPPNYEDPESLCLSARSRALGGPLSHDEVVSYLSLLRDDRWVPDPNDPPSYDWSGGPAQAGGSEMQVRSEAAKTLQTCGGDKLVRALTSRFFGSSVDSEREYFAGLAVELLSAGHSFVLSLLRHESPMIRTFALSGFAHRGWQNYENIMVLAPLLIDESDAVVAKAVAIFGNLRSWFKAVPAGTLPSNTIQIARERLRPPNGNLKLRLESFALVALLTEDWKELASLIETLSAEDNQIIVSLEYFGVSAIDGVLKIQPSLRSVLKAAIFAKFQSGVVGKRYFVMSEVCFFSPDSDAFELALSELRFRSACGYELVSFVKHSPSFMPAIVDAAFERPSNTQADAVGFMVLMQCNPEAFAHAIAASPTTRELRLDKLDKILSCLASSRDGETLMSTLRENLARLAPKVKRAKPRGKKSKAPMHREQSPSKEANCFAIWTGSVAATWRSESVRIAIHQFWRDPSQGLHAVAAALETSGCDCNTLLDHLRSERPHRKGCWVNSVMRQLSMTSSIEKSWAKKHDSWNWHNTQNQVDFSSVGDAYGELGDIPMLSVNWNAARLRLAEDLEGPFGVFLIDAKTDALLGISHLVNIVALGIVYRGQRKLKGFQQLALLPNLNRLELRGAGITDLAVDKISKHPQLRYLGFLNSQLTDAGLENIRQLEGLEALNLPECRGLSDLGLQPIGRMSNLKVLNLLSTKVTDDGLRSLETLDNLEHLCLSWNKEITDVGVASLSRLPRLKHLQLFRATMTDAGLAHLSQVATLENLMICETAVTNAGMRSLSKLKHLKVLNVSATNIGNEGMENLSKCHNIEELDVSNSKVGDMGLRAIRNLGRLRYLNLVRTEVSDEGMKQLKMLANLEVLILSDLPLSDAGVEHLSSLGKLSELKLNGTRITDRSLKSFASIASLNIIDLGGNPNLSESGVQELRERLPYCDVRWYPPVPHEPSPMDMDPDFWR